MTEAQQAAFRLLATTPRERIHVHEFSPPARPEPKPRKPGGGRPVSDITINRRMFIAEHRATMSVQEMANHLRLSRTAINDHINALDGRTPRKKAYWHETPELRRKRYARNEKNK